jgi:amino acid transporter
VLGSALAQDPAIRATPIAAVGTKLFGPVGAFVLTLATLASTAGYVLGDVLASPRILFALATDGHIPRMLARLHLRHDTPAVAIVLHGTLAAMLAVTGTFNTLVILTNVAILVLYLVCCVAAFVLLRRDAARARSGGVSPSDAAFTPPFGPAIPILACGVILWLLAQARWQEFAAVAAAVAIATLAYALKRRVRGIEGRS